MKSRGFVVALLAVAFFALRLSLLAVRPPFFDELFTIWISGKSFAGILDALRSDSGPPLYYFTVHALGIGSVTGGRLLSLLFSSVAFGCLLAATHLGRMRFLAAALIAVFPPSVLFSADARAYALCAMLVTIAVLLIDAGRAGDASRDDRTNVLAAAALLLAAYAHYYGVLFFPLLWRRPRILALVLLLYVPGFWLAWQQPRAATEWMASRPAWPDALFLHPPLAGLAAFALLVTACAARWTRMTELVAIPLLAAIVFTLAGRNVYLPLRFESVLAGPLALMLAASVESWQGRLRVALGVGLFGLFAIFSVAGIVDHAVNGVPDEYLRAAEWLGRNVPRSERVVASGYLYLPVIVSGRPDALAYPAEQAIHPGWRAFAKVSDIPPAPPFVWIGEDGTRERALVGRSHHIEPLYVNGRAMVARIR